MNEIDILKKLDELTRFQFTYTDKLIVAILRYLLERKVSDTIDE